MCIQQLGEPLGDAGDADVPGDVPRHLACRDAEVAERTRQHPTVMIRDEQEGRLSFRIHLMHGRNVTLAEQLIGRLGGVLVHPDCL